MDKTIRDVADMLKDASERLRDACKDESNASQSLILRPTSTSSASTSTTSRCSTAASTPTSSRHGQVANRDEESRNTLRETLGRARSMITGSLSSGGNRRLNRRERLRFTAPYNSNTSKNEKKVKPKKPAKPMEFSLLRCYDDHETDIDGHTLKWDSVIANGMIMAEEEDNEGNLRKKLKESLVKKFPLLGVNDFEFVKVKQKKITVLDLGPDTEYGYPVVKKMAGQGLLYIKVKQGYDFIYNDDAEELEEVIDIDDDHISSHPSQLIDDTPTTPPSTTTTATTDQSPSSNSNFNVQPIVIANNNSSAAEQTGPSIHAIDEEVTEINNNALVKSTNVPPSSDPRAVSQLLIEKIIAQGYENGLRDSVHILSVIQKVLIHGRKLDLTNEDEDDNGEGATNYICVNREDILKTTFNELACVEDFCCTFEVDFIGEKAHDLGGPRKEWIRHVNRAIKEKYFEHGLLDFSPNDYFLVGVMMGIALLQNGQLPKFLPKDIIAKMLLPSDDACILQLQNGLQIFGFLQFFQAFPTLLELLQPTEEKLTPRVLLNLLTPKFSPDGSTAIQREKELYSMFVHYVRQVASGRRHPLTLNSILEFVTCASEEPVLGFARQPSIIFVSGEQVDNNGNSRVHYLPTAHTCSNTLELPRGLLAQNLPEESKLFELYDLAFGSQYFGLV